MASHSKVESPLGFKRIYFDLEPETAQRLKVAAAAAGITQKAYLHQIINAAVGERKHGKSKK